ncbi:unnamed protein product [Caenorhabditis nigoni]
MPIELQQEPMKPDDDFDVAEDKLDHFDHFPALMEEVLDQQRKEMLHPKKSMAFLPVSFDAWLDANVEGWRTENLDEVNERLANWGPIQLSTANDVIIYGVVRVSAATPEPGEPAPGGDPHSGVADQPPTPPSPLNYDSGSNYYSSANKFFYNRKN